MAQTKHLQFLRHEAPLTSLAAAKAAFGELALANGEPALTFYTDTTTGAQPQAVLAIGGPQGRVYFYTGGEIEKLIAAAKAEIIGTATGDFVTLGGIQGKIEAMDLTQVGGSDGDVLTTVAQADGVVTASKASLSDVKLAGYAKTTDTGAIAATDSLEVALSKLENAAAQISVASDDKTVTVTTTSGGTDLAVNIDGTTIVKDASTGVLSTDLKIKSIAQESGSTYASQYQLVYGESNTPIGDVISVAKDQFLKEASFNPTTQVLTLVMYNSTGGTTSVEVDFGGVVVEAEAGQGLYMDTTTSAHTLNVGVDANSEAVTIGDGQTAAVLTVGADSIKVDHIQDAIDYAVSTLDATVTGATTDNFITVQVDEADGKLTGVTVTDVTAAVSGNTNGLATANDVKAYVDNQIDDLAISASGDVTYVTAAVDATDNKKINVAVTEKVQLAVASAETAVQNVVGDTGNNFIDVAATKGAGNVVTLEVDESELVDKINSIDAQLTALSGTSASTSGETSVWGAKNYADAIVNALTAADIEATPITGDSGHTAIAGDDVQEQMENVSASLKALEDGAYSGITASNAGVVVSAVANNGQTVGAQISASSNEILTIEDDGICLGLQWDCGTF